MIRPIVTANQSVNSSSPYFKGMDKATNSVENSEAKTSFFKDNEKLDVNFEGCRIHSLNGNKVNYFA